MKEQYLSLAENIIIKALFDYSAGVELKAKAEKLEREIEESGTVDVEKLERELRKAKYNFAQHRKNYNSALNFFRSEWFVFLSEVIGLNPEAAQEKIFKKNYRKITGKLPENDLTKAISCVYNLNCREKGK